MKKLKEQKDFKYIKRINEYKYISGYEAGNDPRFQYERKWYYIKDINRMPISEEEVNIYNAAQRYLSDFHDNMRTVINSISDYNGPTSELENWIKSYPKPKDELNSSEFQRTYLNLKNIKNVELVAVNDLIKFREFDRRDGTQEKDVKIDNLKMDIITNGIKEPVIIEYSIYDKAIFLTEGNHRLNAAIELGMEYIPARVITTRTPFGNYFRSKALRVPGINPNEHGFVPAELKPSEIGLKVKPLDDEWLYDDYNR